ncbi:MAG: ATP-binding protein [Bacillota bacterium]
MHVKTREDIINNFIFTVQVLFCLMTLIIIFKYFGFQSYDFAQAFVVTFLIVAFLGSIGYFSFYLGKQNAKIDFAIIFIDFLFITFLFFNTGYFELRFLYLIPIIIASIKFSLRTSITVAALVGVVNLMQDLIKFASLPVNYSIETDLMFVAVYIMVSWLIGNFVQIEKNIRNSLYKAQENLIKQSSLLENLINEMPLCVVVIDKKENIVHINNPALEYAGIIGKKPEDFIGTSYRNYINQLFGENFNYNDLLILESLHKGKPYFNEKLIRGNKLLEAIIQPIYDMDDTIVYAMSIFYDITSEEILNEKIRQLERLNLIGQMGASIAHEIKNPLTTIKGFLQLAQRSEEKLTGQQLELLVSEIERCNSIIADFLSISKKSTKNFVRSDMKALLERQLVLIERDAMLSNVKVITCMEEAYLYLNENEIKQLFLNLTHNAIEAMPQGGSLYITLSKEGEKIILSIKDNGSGIPAEVAKSLGTPFITTKKNGTGLGLSVCYRIVENHGAKIEFNSVEGEGTEAVITFYQEAKA